MESDFTNRSSAVYDEPMLMEYRQMCEKLIFALAYAIAPQKQISLPVQPAPFSSRQDFVCKEENRSLLRQILKDAILDTTE